MQLEKKKVIEDPEHKRVLNSNKYVPRSDHTRRCNYESMMHCVSGSRRIPYHCIEMAGGGVV